MLEPVAFNMFIKSIHFFSNWKKRVKKQCNLFD